MPMRGIFFRHVLRSISQATLAVGLVLLAVLFAYQVAFVLGRAADGQLPGSLVLELDVCVDQPLRRWILGFGCDARVLAPSSLVGEISYLLNQARAVYAGPAEMAS